MAWLSTESNLTKFFTRLWNRVLPDPTTLKNLLWNSAGTGAPLLAALVAVPILLSHLGVERFGILSLAWVIVGYFGFFDLGLGRAITQLVAQRIGTNQQGDIPAIVQAGLVAMTALGVLGGLAVALLSPWIVRTQLAIPPDLVEETLTAFYILAASIPVVIVTTGIRGVLEGYQRFDIVNIVRAPMGVLIYVGPLLALPFSHELPAVVGVLVVSRVVSLLAYTIACLGLFPRLGRFRSLDPSTLPELLSFGGWMTLSNIAGPLLLYAGRIALIVLVSAESVAFFSTPYDVVISVLLVPGIFVGVLFPVFAERFRSNASFVRPAYRQAILQNLILLLPITVIIALFAEQAISIWINPEFSEQSFRVAQLLALGVFVNSFGYYSQ
ncbi:MAG: oligosaccharide flippase family protein, partial [Devosia sp.]